MTSRMDALAKLGLSPGETLPELLAEAFGFVPPILPGRGCSLDQATFDRFLTSVMSGTRPSRAASRAGMPYFSRWMREGRKDIEQGHHTNQAVLVRACEQAEGIVEDFCGQVMLASAPGDWRAANNILKDRFGLGKAEATAVEVEVKDREEQMDRLRRALPKYATPTVIDAED